MMTKIRKRMSGGEGGFTLIELLVVIIIIAILAAIAIPTFLGQRQKANDAAAKSLVRNAMTAAESAFVDTRTFVFADADVLTAIEPSIVFTIDNSLDASSGTSLAKVTAEAAQSQVVYGSGDAAIYNVGTKSASGNYFGVMSNKGASGGTAFYKIIGGDFSSGW